MAGPGQHGVAWARTHTELGVAQVPRRPREEGRSRPAGLRPAAGEPDRSHRPTEPPPPIARQLGAALPAPRWQRRAARSGSAPGRERGAQGRRRGRGLGCGRTPGARRGRGAAGQRPARPAHSPPAGLRAPRPRAAAQRSPRPARPGPAGLR